ncbi:MAG: DUF1858 domain-containing protein [Clostridia bacterium]|nr:DUF1858 domain-containing protein [Clostridia bacterium]
MVTKDMLIADVLKMGDVDKIAEVFAGFGMHCLMCMLSHGETLEQAAAAHGVDVNDILTALDAVIK